MASQKVVVEESSGVTASQLKDFFRQVEDSSITRAHFQAFLEHRNAWGFDSLRENTLSVVVNPSREWREAIDACAPDTFSDSEIYGASSKYPGKEMPVYTAQVVLVSTAEEVVSTKMLFEWAVVTGCRIATPRECFAIAEQEPDLHVQLGLPSVTLASLQERIYHGSRRFCYVWYEGGERQADLGYGSDKLIAKEQVFAFVRNN